MEDHPSLVRLLAHELRDALSPMRSAIDLLRLRNFDADAARRTAEKVDRGLDCALAAIDAFVLAEQCESGVLPVAAAECSLGQMVESARVTLAAVFEARSQRCAFTAPSPEIRVWADAAKSRQVISAMLEQASAAAPAQSQIDIEASTGSDGPALRVRFAVEGVAPPSASWFEDYRARPRGSRMALRSARQVMALQHGQLELAVSGGTAQLVARFAPAVPGRATQPAAAEVPPPSVPAASPRDAMHILIVDDSEEVRSIYREALVALGYTVTEAANAEEALSTATTSTPDVALIDIHLPGMNGYRLAQSLRARSSARVRLVMLSGMTLDDTTLKLSRNAGFDDCIDKAAGPKALHTLLQAPAA